MDFRHTHFDLPTIWAESAERELYRLLREDFAYRDELEYPVSAGITVNAHSGGSRSSLDHLKCKGLEYVDIFVSHRVDAKMSRFARSCGTAARRRMSGSSSLARADAKMVDTARAEIRCQFIIAANLLNRWVESGLPDPAKMHGVGRTALPSGQDC